MFDDVFYLFGYDIHMADAFGLCSEVQGALLSAVLRVVEIHHNDEVVGGNVVEEGSADVKRDFCLRREGARG